MLDALGPRRERGTSATLPDVPRFVEGFVVDSGIDPVEISSLELKVWRGKILALNWTRETNGDLKLRRSTRRIPVVNLDNAAIVNGTYVRAEYHSGLREYVVYWQACGDFGLTYPDEDDPEVYDAYTVVVEDMPE